MYKPEEKKKLIAERFGSQLPVWKQKYSAVFGYVSEDGKMCVLRAPDLSIIDACRTIAGGSSIKFDIALVDNCWLDGDDCLRKEDKYRMGLFDWLGVIIVKVEGALVEL